MKKFLLLLAVAASAFVANAERTTIWKNDGSLGAVSWNGIYRFGLEGHDGAGECAATFDAATWKTLMSEKFYIEIEKSASTNIRITNGWWDTTFGGTDYNWAPNLNGSVLEIDLSSDPDFVATLEEKHLLFTGEAYTLLEIYTEGTADEPTPGANHALKLTQDAAKANPWDTQVFINIQNLKEGEKYTIELDVMGGAEFTLGTETIDDAQEEHMTEWNASAVFNYTDEIKVTTDWSRGLINAPGVTDVNCHTHCTPKVNGGEISHKDGNTSSCNVAVHAATTYAATAILLNVGKTVGELLIDNIVVKDSKGNVVYTEDFENAKVAADNKSATAYFPGWQGAKWEIVESAVPTSIDAVEANEADEVAYDLFGNAGATKGFMVKNGKKVYVK